MDTIAAIATGLTDSGIGIIRLSGPEAITIADRIFSPANRDSRLADLPGYRACFGKIVYDDTVYDEAIALVMRAPKTYTREDVVELNCHGGISVLKKVLDLLVSLGVRPAEPGEFTKRAFLNGRIDLAQAESVMDLIHAKNDMAIASSLKQLSGALGKTIRHLREKLLYNIAYIESALDDPENYSLDGFDEKLTDVVDKLSISIRSLLHSYDNGRLLTEGIRTIIVGKPNAGKSSVLNFLMGEERAIVTDIEGTTRDTLEETVNVDGITLSVVDTAGIRETDNTVEKIGIEKALSSIEEADLILYIVDGTRPLDENDEEIMSKIKGKPSITLLNKNDQQLVVDKLSISEKIDTHFLEISALEHRGYEEFSSLLREMFFSNEVKSNSELMITSARHKALLSEALSSLDKVRESINAGMGEDFYTIDLMAAYASLGKILGEELEDDLVDKIFSEFCMGK